jgi:hypothetical protein
MTAKMNPTMIRTMSKVTIMRMKPRMSKTSPVNAREFIDFAFLRWTYRTDDAVPYVQPSVKRN